MTAIWAQLADAFSDFADSIMKIVGSIVAIMFALAYLDSKGFDTHELILIAGGYDKNFDYSCLASELLKKVKTLILMGLRWSTTDSSRLQRPRSTILSFIMPDT